MSRYQKGAVPSTAWSLDKTPSAHLREGEVTVSFRGGVSDGAQVPNKKHRLKLELTTLVPD
jgi:hypothetical protein